MHSRPNNVAQALLSAPWRVLTSRWPWLALVYVLLNAIIGLALIPITTVTFLLLPLWALALGAFERLRLRMLGFGKQASGHVRVVPGERHNWLQIRLTEPATWRELLVLILDLALGALSLPLVLTQLGTIAALAISAFELREHSGSLTLFSDLRLSLGPDNWWSPLLLIPVALIIAAYLNLTLATLQSLLVRWLLKPRRAELDARIETLTRSRAAIVAAHEEERRRIERDLHDGVQQELVVLATRLAVLDLELSALGAEAAPAREALAATQTQAERATAALRNTVRGIHPAVLTDHGLGAALDELAGRCSIPVRITRAELGRTPASIEATGYFVATEALTNAVKHTDATLVTIRAHTTPDELVLCVRDNGSGGADPARGTGLRGLSERASALGGSLTVSSPLGGPTELVLTAPIPRESVARALPRHPEPEQHPDAKEHRAHLTR